MGIGGSRSRGKEETRTFSAGNSQQLRLVAHPASDISKLSISSLIYLHCTWQLTTSQRGDVWSMTHGWHDGSEDHAEHEWMRTSDHTSSVTLQETHHDGESDTDEH